MREKNPEEQVLHDMKKYEETENQSYKGISQRLRR